MLKSTILAAFAVATCSAFAQSGMMDVDAKTSKPDELMTFLNKDAYKKLSAPDAYVLTSFIGDLPGNYRTAVLRGLIANTQEAYAMRAQMQNDANMMAPMGDMMPPMEDSGFRQGHRGERSFEMIAKDPMARLSYWDTLALLQKDQDATDRNLIRTLFMARPFTEEQVPTVKNERAFDALERYIKANAMSTQPARLKYTSLAPHNYVSPMIPR